MPRSSLALLVVALVPGFAHGQGAEGARQATHEVVKGNTLWVLAERYLGDPFRWPLLYEANRDRIKDPHWIFPGQVLVIPAFGARGEEPETVVVGVVVSPEPAGAAPLREPIEAGEPCPGPRDRSIFYLGSQVQRGCALEPPFPENRTAFYPTHELMGGGVMSAEEARWPAVPRGLVYSAPWLEDEAGEAAPIGSIHRLAEISRERTDRERVAPYEKVHLRVAEGSSLRVGDVLQTFRPLRVQEGLGRVMVPTGIVTITEVGEGGATAWLTGEFDRVTLGDYLRPVPPYSLEPGVHPVKVQSHVVATVLAFPQEREIHGFGAFVFLDVGEEEGIAVGDEFVARVNEDQGFEGAEAVRVQVVGVQRAVCTARVVALMEPVLRLGTRLRLVKKMPV